MMQGGGPASSGARDRKRIGSKSRPEMLQKLCDIHGEQAENMIRRIMHTEFNNNSSNGYKDLTFQYFDNLIRERLARKAGSQVRMATIGQDQNEDLLNYRESNLSLAKVQPKSPSKVDNYISPRASRFEDSSMRVSAAENQYQQSSMKAQMRSNSDAIKTLLAGTEHIPGLNHEIIAAAAMKKSGYLRLGGQQQSRANASMLQESPLKAGSSTNFFSPQARKGNSNTISFDPDLVQGDLHSINKTQNRLQSLQPGSSALNDRRNSYSQTRNIGVEKQSTFSPVFHRPMVNYGGLTLKGASNTARASSLHNRPFDNQAQNFTKTSIQTRAQGMVKPKAYNAWDILALNDMIKGQIEDHNRKEREHQQRIEMRQFYDTQVDAKRQQKEMQMQNDRSLGQSIKEKVMQVNSLADLDNTKRMLARGQIAVDNIKMTSMARQKQDIVEAQAKVETLRNLQANGQINVQRHQIQQKVKEQNRRTQLDMIQRQIVEKQLQNAEVKRDEKELHLQNLQEQEVRFNKRQSDLNEHIQSIKDRDDLLNQHMENPLIVTATKQDVAKNQHVERLAGKMYQVEQLRQQQRDQNLQQRRDYLKKEADEHNKLTIKNHQFTKNYEKTVKAKDGRFANQYAPEALMANHAKAERSVPNQAGDIINVRDQKLTGLKKADPYRLTTVRQKNMYQDEIRRIEADRMKKAQLRADLEHQMQAKVFKRERERLYLDDKSLVTSKGLLQGVGANLPNNRPQEETTDLNLLEKDEQFTDNQVKALQRIANAL